MSVIAPELLFQSMSALRAEHRELQKIYRDQGVSPAMVLRIEDFIRRGRATGAILDDEEDQTAVQTLLDFWGTCLYRDNHPVPDTTLAPFDPDAAPTLDNNLVPYVGLGCFMEANRDLFFGRDAVVASLIERLRQQNLLAISGPSGSGKSSLALAGVVPALKSGALPGSKDWRYLGRMVPGSSPFENLSKLLLRGQDNRGGPAQALAEQLRRKPDNLREWVANKGGGPAVLVIDQFEELSTLCEDNSVREAFEKMMVSFVQDGRTRHILVLTMRSDFIGAVARQPELQNLLETALAPVTPLSAGELREAILFPAERVGLKFESGVVESLVHDILGEPAALPLLQFTLLKLWEHRDHNRITAEAYRDLGGGRLALTRSADRFITSLIPQERIMAERILLRLVRCGMGQDNVANRIRKNSLYSIGPEENVDRVLNKLVEQHLVRLTSGEIEEDAEVEVAHEALVRNWQHLVALLDAERDRMTMLRRLELKAAEWVRLGRGTASLLRDAALVEAEEALARPEIDALGASNDLRQLVNASRHAANAARKRASLAKVVWGIVAGFVVFGIVSIGFGIRARRAEGRAKAATIEAERQSAAATLQRDKAEQERKIADGLYRTLRDTDQKLKDTNEKLKRTLSNANLYEAHRMVDFANKALTQDPERAALLALEAAGVLRNNNQELSPEVQDSLVRAMQSNRVRAVIPASSEIRDLAFSSDALQLAAAGKDEPVRIWDAISGRELSRIEGARNATAIAFSSSGRQIAAAVGQGIQIFDASGKPRGGPYSTNALLRRLFFGPEDKYIAAIDSNGNVELWPAGFQSVKTLAGVGARITAVAFHPAGQVLVTGSDDGSIQTWDLNSGNLMQTAAKGGRKNAIKDLAFNTDGISVRVFTGNGQQDVLTFSPDAEPAFVQVKDSSGTAVPANISSGILAFSPDNRFAAAPQGTVIKIWDMGNRAANPLQPLANSQRQSNVPDLVSRAAARLTEGFTNSDEAASEGRMSCIQQDICAGLQAAVPRIIEGNRLARMEDRKGAVAQFEFALRSARWLSNGGKGREWALRQFQFIQDQMRDDRTRQQTAAQAYQAQVGTAAYRNADILFRSAAYSADRQGDAQSRERWRARVREFDPEKASVLAASLEKSAHEHLNRKEISQALEDIAKARSYQPQIPLDHDAVFNNALCWEASVSESVFFNNPEIVAACGRAVDLSGGAAAYRYSRGVNRSRNADYKGALDDFRSYARQSRTSQERQKVKKTWISALEKGRDPFTNDELKKLRGTGAGPHGNGGKS